MPGHSVTRSIGLINLHRSTCSAITLSSRLSPWMPRIWKFSCHGRHVTRVQLIGSISPHRSRLPACRDCRLTVFENCSGLDDSRRSKASLACLPLPAQQQTNTILRTPRARRCTQYRHPCRSVSWKWDRCRTRNRCSARHQHSNRRISSSDTRTPTVQTPRQVSPMGTGPMSYARPMQQPRRWLSVNEYQPQESSHGVFDELCRTTKNPHSTTKVNDYIKNFKPDPASADEVRETIVIDHATMSDVYCVE